ncbi:hypothetical protein PLESTM_001794900, partial [Pleodorina starrii]
MGLLCCFTGDTAEQQHFAQQQDARLDITPATTSITAGRGTPVAPLASSLASPSIVAAGAANDHADEDGNSSPATSRNLLKLPAGAPRFSELYARLSHIRGSWHARGIAAMHVLSQQLGLQIATLWALSSDGTYFVVQASAGRWRAVLRPGASSPAALGDRQANSLQRVQASKMTTIYSCLDDGGPADGSPAAAAAAATSAAGPGGSLDPDLANYPNHHLPNNHLPRASADRNAAAVGAASGPISASQRSSRIGP